MTNTEGRQTKSHFLLAWVIAGGIGGILSMFAFYIFDLTYFVNGAEPPPPQLTVSYPVEVAFIGILSGLPFGIAQWLILRSKFRNSHLWMFTGGIGLAALMLPVYAGYDVLPASVDVSSPVLFLLGWTFSGLLAGGLQALVLRNQIRKAGLLIPIYMLAILAAEISLLLGSMIFWHGLGFIIGDFLAGATSSLITGLFLRRFSKIPL